MTSARRRRRQARLAQAQSDNGSDRAVWPGVPGGRFRPLADSEQSMVHESALVLLETLGLSQAIPSMIEMVTGAGGRLTDDGRLLFPRGLVNNTIDAARRDVVLYSRAPGRNLDLSGARVHMSTGGSAPGIFDLETGGYRQGTARDLYDAARLVDTLEHIHHFSRSIVACDATDSRQLDINTAFACLAGTSKPVSMSVSEPANMAAIAALCYRVAGGEAAFRARPFMTIMVCHVVPPMRFAQEACETLEAAVRAGFPVQVISAGQAGATSPASLAGSLVQAVAETLAGLVFARLIDANVAALFAPKPLVVDLRTGSMCGGGGEQAILMAAAAQMGRYYDLPTSSIAGITDAKVADAQHGSEKCLAVSLAAHAGSNLVTQACGMQASLLGVSLESYMVDNDMLGNILRTLRGTEVTVENMAADVIAQVCRGEGHYLGHPQTLARMKSDYLYPLLSDRLSPGEWQENGRTDILARSRDAAKEVLKTHFPNYLDAEIERDLRSQFDILISPAVMARQEIK